MYAWRQQQQNTAWIPFLQRCESRWQCRRSGNVPRKRNNTMQIQDSLKYKHIGETTLPTLSHWELKSSRRWIEEQISQHLNVRTWKVITLFSNLIKTIYGIRIIKYKHKYSLNANSSPDCLTTQRPFEYVTQPQPN